VPEENSGTRLTQLRRNAMKRWLKVALIALFLGLFAFGIFGTGVAVGVGGTNLLAQPHVAQAASLPGQPAEFDTFWQAWALVHHYFVDREALDTSQLTYGAIRGMVTALGDEGHTTFLTPEEVQRHRADTSGVYSGIGAQIGMENGMPVIVSPFDGSPAQKAGVKAGDIILEVDGQDVTTWTLNEIVEHIRGEEGTEVTLSLFRPDETESYEFTIVRGEIDSPTATWAMLPGTNVAMIRLSQFSTDAADEVQQAIRQAKAEGAAALIFDIRSNPGGLLQQAISVTSQFLKNGNVMQQEDAEGNREVYPVQRGGIATDIPMVVLINRGSASSSEIFAGAMQDHNRAKVVGETTFGTGTVLETFPLNDGSALMLGTSQWLTANGRLIRKQGITPDVEVKVPVGAELIYPAVIKDLTVADLLASEDLQVLKALELLDALPTE
jgi:carboxyl-terminal processing protease